jgi:DNA-binding FrmR family transcriptional regulator
MPASPTKSGKTSTAKSVKVSRSSAAEEPSVVDLSIGCGCGVPGSLSDEERKAVAVDPEAKSRNLLRLRRIEGQVRGLQKMVDEDRYCADIMTQISSTHEALRAVGRELMRNHLKHCAASAIKAGGEDAAEMYDELVDMMYKHSR